MHNSRDSRVNFFVPGLHGKESFHSLPGSCKGLKLGSGRWPAGGVQGSLQWCEMALQAVGLHLWTLIMWLPPWPWCSSPGMLEIRKIFQTKPRTCSTMSLICQSKIHTEKMAKEKLNLILCATKEALYNLKRKNNDKNSIEARLSSNHFHLFSEVLHKTFTFKETFFFFVTGQFS